MNITYYGHACFGLEVNGEFILTDPFISPNKLASHINIDEIKADYILVSHGHKDHIFDLEYIAKKTNATIISNFEIIEWLSEKGYKQLHAMNVGGNFCFNFGSIKCVYAAHSSRLPDGTNGGNPMGFIIKTKDKNLYFAGDTALSMEMQLLGDFEKIDLAILPIGDNFTMGIKDAIIAAGFVGCNEVIGMHYDTFPDIKINKESAMEEFNKKGVRLRLFDIGKTTEI